MMHLVLFDVKNKIADEIAFQSYLLGKEMAKNNKEAAMTTQTYINGLKAAKKLIDDEIDEWIKSTSDSVS